MVKIFHLFSFGLPRVLIFFSLARNGVLSRVIMRQKNRDFFALFLDRNGKNLLCF